MNLLYASAAALLAVLTLAGCTGDHSVTGEVPGHQPVTGQVTGRLMSVNSRTSDKRPMAGTVTFIAPGRQRVAVQAGTSGNFSAQLPPGRYQVSGPCSQSFPVTVTAHQSTHVDVYCIVRVSSPPAF